MKYLLFIAFELSGILFFGIVFSTVRLVYYKSIPTIQELINPVIVGMIVGSIAWIWRNRTKWYATRLEEEISRREQTEEDLVEFNNHLEDLVKKRTYELEAEVIERKKAEESLRSSEESLKETAMIAKVGGWETDLRGNTLTWSDETFRIHERDDKRLPDVATAIQYYHPEDQQIVSNAVQRAIEKGETFDFETRLITEKKTLKWVRAIGHVVSHQDNAVGIRGMIQDISEKKLADEQIKASLKEKETLLHEIHHRVKNNMQIIASLLDMQLNRKGEQTVESIISESKGRVYAMAAVHECFHQSDNLFEIDLNAYLQHLSGLLKQTFVESPEQVSFDIGIPELKLGIDKANPLGLVLNELISNSLKYAFPDNQNGQISIKAIIREKDTVQLIVSDDGIGMPDGFDWTKTNTLGLRLVKDLIERQLNGSVAYENHGGAQFTIKFNLESDYIS